MLLLVGGVKSAHQASDFRRRMREVWCGERAMYIYTAGFKLKVATFAETSGNRSAGKRIWCYFSTQNMVLLGVRLIIR